MKIFINKFLKPKILSTKITIYNTQKEIVQTKLFDHFVVLLTVAMLCKEKEACFLLAKLYYHGNGYNILPNPNIGDLTILIGQQLGNKECLEAELKYPKNSAKMKKIVFDIINDITADEEVINLIIDLERLHVCYEDLKPMDLNIDEEWILVPWETSCEGIQSFPIKSKINSLKLMGVGQGEITSDCLIS
ncbi:hypothetical protein [Rickettsia endosymbiont of Halotydeus destructor]|uniref:hypothetical protein n=1 Tax=Rickettsia endosymbiont of Halotydeus destructor TaxID=2996754 RepID=UPI003BB158A8